MLPVRFIHVTGTTRLDPHLVRVTFTGIGLGDLGHREPDQQVKLYFPKPGQNEPRLPDPDDDFTHWYQAYNAIPEAERPPMRGYTLRAHRPDALKIDIDFVLHDDHPGPATRWASTARPGDTLGMFGPSVDFARRAPIDESIRAADWFLLAGDETALPAIGSLLESLPAGTRATAYIEVPERAREQRFDTRGDVTVHWLRRGAGPARHGELLGEAVRGARFPAGSVFAWLAGESGAVRALRRHLVDERGLAKHAIDFTGHWRRALTQDDAPTAEDLADAREHLAETPAPARPATAQTPPADVFDRAYESRTAPWVIGGPQPAIVALERDGRIRGTVLDAGCGTGEHTVHLARLGYDVHGIDASAPAIDQARAKAAGHQVTARFDVADALNLAGEPTYDTIVDSALFHIFGPEDRARYVRSLHRACRPGGLVHVLALSDSGPGFGPEVSDTVIREAFADGWVVEELRASEYRGVTGEAGELGDLPAWLARVRRI